MEWWSIGVVEYWSIGALECLSGLIDSIVPLGQGYFPMIPGVPGYYRPVPPGQMPLRGHSDLSQSFELTAEKRSFRKIRQRAMSSAQLSAVFFFQLFFILAICRGVGILARRFGQPQVVGEMIAGVIMGPSLCGLRPSPCWRGSFTSMVVETVQRHPTIILVVVVVLRSRLFLRVSVSAKLSAIAVSI
jgi:hypothetical protein